MKYTPLILVLLGSMNSIHAWNPFNDPATREYAYITATAVTSGGLFYTWLQKRSLERAYEKDKKRFKNQKILSDSYESALAALSDYKEYVEIIARNESPEKGVDDLCQQLMQDFSQKSSLLHAFKKTVLERKLELEKKNKEIERALAGWQHSKKKALLTQQGPFLKNTYSLILTTLSSLHAHVAYVEAAFFLKDHSYLFVEECALEKYLYDTAQFKYQLDKLIRTKTRVGERYPFRAYAQWVDHYYELIKDLKKDLENYTYYEFQQPVVSSLKETYTILDILKKQIKISPEYEAECAQYNAELLAHRREDENRKLKEQLAYMKDQLKTLQQPPEELRA
jgi:hypothetical protein